MNAKNGSARGFDRIPYDVLKFRAVIAVLNEPFQLIFDCSIIPSIWRKSTNVPILKDQRIPLHYRGNSLLSCVNKLYTSFINNVFQYIWNQTILWLMNKMVFEKTDLVKTIFLHYILLYITPKHIHCFYRLKKVL